MNNELYHHGIKGQRWGVRRFQNEDGSLTSAGRKHYDVDDTRGSYSTSKRIRKLQAKYESKGLSPDQAQKAAIRRRNVERVVAVTAAVAITAVAAYAVHKNGQRAKTLASDILKNVETAPIERISIDRAPISKATIEKIEPVRSVAKEVIKPPVTSSNASVTKMASTAANVVKETAKTTTSAPKPVNASNIKLGFDTVGSFNNQELLRSLNDLKNMNAAQNTTMRGQETVLNSLDEFTRSFLR